jgi:6-pyruvoyltetrahydropterin/6-carboxytetrahydropterin synthase
MQTYIKKEFRFEYGHRLLNHPTKCKNIHGHNQRVIIYARSKTNKLNDLGMVIDFNDLKEGIGKWIDEHWDHALIFNKDDVEIKKMFENTSFKTYKMPYNPTAENMSLYLIEIICPYLYRESDIEIFKIEVYENDFSSAVSEI